MKVSKANEARVTELAGFIEALTERFKANESMFADRLEVSERELALLRAVAREGPMISREVLADRYGERPAAGGDPAARAHADPGLGLAFWIAPLLSVTAPTRVAV